MKQKTGLTQAGWRALTIAACVQASACGGVSTDERRDPDDLAVETDALSTDCGSSGAEPPTGICAPVLLDGYAYAEAPSLWPGSQSVGSMGVQGSGYLVSLAHAGDPALRFSRATDLFVGPDGTLEDTAGRELLGYAPESEDFTCLVPLRAPATVPAAATRHVALQMNLDAREPVVAFDAADPSGTSNTSISFSIFDDAGAPRTIDIYFQRREPLRWGYHAFADGSDIEGGTPGEPVALGQGRLTFTSSGALESVLTSGLCASFAGGAAPEQCLTIDFGRAIAEGGDGFGGATSFASFSAVMALAVDGYAAGTAAGVAIDPDGLAKVFFDNGTAAPFGVLALARFPRERKLAETADGSFVATPASGTEELGVPGEAGRGVLYYRELAVSP